MSSSATVAFLCQTCRGLISPTFQATDERIAALLADTTRCRPADTCCCCCLGLLEPASRGWQSVVAALRRELAPCQYSATVCSLGIEYPAGVAVRCWYFGVEARAFKTALRDMIDGRFLRAEWGRPHVGWSCPLVVSVDVQHAATERQLSTWLPRFGVLPAGKKTRLGRGAAKLGHNQVQRAVETTPRLQQHLAAHVDELLFADTADGDTFTVSAHCLHAPVFLAGRYRKLQRGVSQTEWTARGQRLAQHSVAEIVAPPLAEAFGSRGDLVAGATWNFLAAGREDADVRMLGSDGRPFIVEVLNPTRTSFAEVGRSPADLQAAINAQQPHLVQIADLQQVTLEQRNAFTRDDSEVRKSYACEVWLSVPVTDAVLHAINATANLAVRQETPIRVLHRRAPGFRTKLVISMHAERIDAHHLRLEITTEGGTYIKEFVHGDHGRTTPSLGTLLACQADILSLDVIDVHVPFPPKLSHPQ